MKKLVYLCLLLSHMVVAQKFQQPYNNYWSHFNAARYDLAQKSLDTLLRLEPNNNYWLLNRAELAAKMGQEELANQYLVDAIKNGYCDLEQLQKNQHLGSLINTSKYQKTVVDLKNFLSAYKLPEAEQKMVFKVPPMMECYAIMLYLGNPKHTLINSKQNHQYFKEIDSYFEKHKQHRLVLELARRYPSSGNDFINNLRGHHNIRTFFAYDSLNISTIKRFPIELDHELAKLVQTFAIETKFMDFYTANAEFYYAMQKIMYSNYAFGSKVIPFFNSHFDLKINRFNVYFSPIYGGWQHGPTARLDGYVECFYFGGIMYTNTKQFYYPTLDLLFTFLTEFDHTTVNDLTFQFKDDFKQFEDKLPLLNAKPNGGYYNLEATLNEYITWAFGLQFFYEQSPLEYDILLKTYSQSMEKNRGFVRFGEFMIFYKNYMDDRKKYPKMKDFYPEIITWLKEQK
jgi:hypothetical protein